MFERFKKTRVRFVVWSAVACYALFVLWLWLPAYVQSLKQVTVQYFRHSVPVLVAEDMRLLDGIKTTTSSVNPPLVGVLIENHVEARPVAGLAEARVVYEAPVEGNITRFFALYPLDELPEKVGPVRSMRPYFLKWAVEWGSPLLAHVGGSADAIQMIKQGRYNDFDEYFNGRFFWRDEKRVRPHNVYTSGELVAVSDRATSTVFAPWRFEQEAPSSTAPLLPEGKEIKITYSRPWYAVLWDYSQEEDVYYRLQAGALHRTEDGKKISASTVVVQRVQGEVLDEVGRLGMELQGEGEAFILKHGERTTSTWKRALGGARTRFYDAKGNEIAFAPGNIWLQIVMPWHEVE